MAVLEPLTFPQDSARIALSCRTAGHWLATMLPTPTRLRRMAVSTGSSKDSRSSLQGTEIVGRHKARPEPPCPQPKEHQVVGPSRWTHRP